LVLIRKPLGSSSFREKVLVVF